MSKINMSDLTSFLCTQSKMLNITFIHHATAKDCIELSKLIKETYDNEEKYGILVSQRLQSIDSVMQTGYLARPV